MFKRMRTSKGLSLPGMSESLLLSPSSTVSGVIHSTLICSIFVPSSSLGYTGLLAPSPSSREGGAAAGEAASISTICSRETGSISTRLNFVKSDGSASSDVFRLLSAGAAESESSGVLLDSADSSTLCIVVALSAALSVSFEGADSCTSSDGAVAAVGLSVCDSWVDSPKKGARVEDEVSDCSSAVRFATAVVGVNENTKLVVTITARSLFRNFLFSRFMFLSSLGGICPIYPRPVQPKSYWDYPVFFLRFLRTSA